MKLIIDLIYNINGLTTVFYLSIIIISFVLLLHHYWGLFNYSNGIKNIFQFSYIIFLVLLIGFRPIGTNGFVDTPMYIEWLKAARLGSLITKDIGFGILVYLCSYFPDRILFVVCSIISISFLVLTSKRISEKNWFLFFIAYISMLYYWNHNVFSIRQGLGAVIFTYALFLDKKWKKYLFLFLALSIHKSYILPFIAYLIVSNFKISIKKLLLFWFASIIVSFLVSEYLIIIIGNFVKFFDTRSIYFLLQHDDNYLYSKTGFRIDMIAYSFISIIFAIYYHFIIYDEKYNIFFKMFLIVNIFFILIINVNQSYRFVYLSWFINPLLIFYPMLKGDNKIKDSYWITLVSYVLLIIIYIPFKTFK